MAEGKKSFVLYTEWLSTFDKMTDQEAGLLVKHLFRYVNDLNPESDRITELLFEPMKLQLKRDLNKFEQRKKELSESGKIGAQKRWRKTNKPIYRKFKHLSMSQDEFDKLSEKYTKEQIDEILDRIENYAKNKNYTSLYKTALNWLKKEPEKKIGRQTLSTIEQNLKGWDQ